MPHAVTTEPKGTERPSFYRRWLSAEGYLGLHLVVGFLLAVATAIVFDRIADAVFSTQDIRLADARAQLLARRVVSPRLTVIMQTISMFGTPPALSSLSLAVIAWLLKVKSHRRLYAFVAASAGGVILNQLLKLYFHRARPDSPLVLAHGYSFPSGHSMAAMCFFGSLAYVVYFTIERRHFLRLAAVAACAAAVIAIGASRIYLGVHYFTDVVAGYTAGLCWMAVCLTGTEAWVRWRDYRARRRGGDASITRVGAMVLAFLPSPCPLPQGGEGLPGPCAECVAWEATTEQAEALLSASDELGGVEVLTPIEPDAPVPAELWERLRRRGARPGALIPRPAPAEPDMQAFLVKTRATELRSRGAELIGLEASASTLAELAKRSLGVYVDFLVISGGAGEARAPGVPVWTRYRGAASLADVLAAAGRVDGERLLVPLFDGAAVAAARGLRDLLPSGLTPLPQVRVACQPEAPAPGEACASAVYLHPRTLEAIALVRPLAPIKAVSVAPPPARVERTPLGPSSPLSPFILRIAGWGGDGDGRFASEVDVIAQRALGVEEIVARHQAAAARQHREVPRLISSGTMVLTFQIPGLAAPMTVGAETVLYQAPGVSEVEQRNIRLNGLDYDMGKAGMPQLPIIEPERVSEPPLTIALNEAYRYRLEGRERRQGRDAYVVAFEPRAEGRSLFRGRAWIDASSFAMLRVEASQTALRGPIVSSQQEDEFVPVPAPGGTAWLLGQSETHQVYVGAGHRTPIHRVLRLTRHEPAPADFGARLEAAHASDAVMLRETAQGFRYLEPAGKADAERRPGQPLRVAKGKSQRVRTAAAGVLVDPNIDDPLPFVGLSYLDFDFLGTGTQINAFFGGAFAQLAFAVPSLGGTRLQLHGGGFATLAEYNDRSFRNGVEIYAEDVRQRPARFTLGLLQPLGTRWRTRADYELAYTRYRQASFADLVFAPPASTPVHGVRLALETQQGPWTASVWWGAARRQRWPAWGLAGNAEYDPGAIGFQRYGVDLGRSFVFSPRMVGRADLAWMAGRGLDRFSRFTFDSFENRLRGYPSAGLRYDRGAVLRTATSWSASSRLRLDGFFDAAYVRDPGFGAREKPYLGVGAGIEAPLPWALLVAVEWGYGFQARDRDGRPGAHVLRATVFRIF